MGKTNIVLAGFMYSGKSTIGVLVARSTGRRLLDTDAMIEAETGSTVSDIFAGPGEAALVRDWGVDAVLVGEELVLSPDPAAMVRSLAGDCR